MAPRGGSTDGTTIEGSSGRDRAPGLGARRFDELTRDEFLWLVGSVCNLHGIPFDAALLARNHVPPHDLRQAEVALEACGFAVEGMLPLDPGVAGEVAGAFALLRMPYAAPALVLAVACDDERVTFFSYPSSVPESLSVADFEGRLIPPLRLPRRRGSVEPTEGRPTFGFRWFIPALLEHKAIWRDVLVASLAIQLLALGMPLMTQAVIDKVIVHRTEATLIALTIGMATFVLFSAALSWIRQYLILHTGARIDAVLGDAVFTHLVRLPVDFCQARPTGVIAARLQGVEQIREFLASSAIGLLLDLPFLVVCVTVMALYSVPLTLIALSVLACIAVVSLAVAPLFQERLNAEFQAGARSQAFLTEHIAGFETV